MFRKSTKYYCVQAIRPVNSQGKALKERLFAFTAFT